MNLFSHSRINIKNTMRKATCHSESVPWSTHITEALYSRWELTQTHNWMMYRE